MGHVQRNMKNMLRSKLSLIHSRTRSNVVSEASRYCRELRRHGITADRGLQILRIAHEQRPTIRLLTVRDRRVMGIEIDQYHIPPAIGAESKRFTGLPSGQKKGSPGRRGFKRLLSDALRGSGQSPGFNSWGAGIGLAAGFACPIGLQFFVITGFRMLFRFNSILALALSQVSNPFTFIPLYYVYYRLGSFILGQPSKMSMETFDGAVRTALEAGYFWETMPALLDIGKDVAIRWSISALIFAVVFGILGYLAARKIQESFSRSTDLEDSPSDESPGPESGALHSTGNESQP